jgi:predicted nucleotidyltransferase
MTGSLCNFNWSKFSDVDLHVYVDFSQFDEEDVEVYKELFAIKKTLFNTQHDIKVKGFDVEVYIEDIEEKHYSSGIYSVLFDEWINEPKKQKIDFDKVVLKNKVSSWMKQIDLLIDENQDEDKETAKKRIELLQDKLKKYRTAGLKKGGEYSYENLVFKFLRRNGYLDKLFDFKNNIVDKNLSLSERTKY